jgi:uncharacterized RDD family membrane protein YckC
LSQSSRQPERDQSVVLPSVSHERLRGQPDGESEPVHAERGRRLIAGVVDFAVTTALLLSVTIPVWGYHSGTHVKVSWSHLLIGLLIYVAIGFLYFPVPHARWGQTPGKWLMRMRVVRAVDHGAISYRQAAIRLVSEQLIFIVANIFGKFLGPLAFLGFLDLAWIIWDPRRQALHDKVAGTVVVDAWRGTPNPYR